MRFSTATLVALAAIPAAVSGQNLHKVIVGDQGQVAYSPTNITANVGDQVAFEFHSKNHTVTQSTFASPCVPANFNGSTGADSGFMFIDPKADFSQSGFPTWTITVNSTGPLWFHCAQTNPGNHCKSGMVFSINATPDKSFDAYLANAKAFDPSTAPPPSGDSGSQISSGSSSDGSAPAASTSIAGSIVSAGSSAPPLSSSAPVTPAPASAPSPQAPAADQSTSSAPSSTPTKSGAARTAVSATGLGGVIGALVLGALMI